MNKDLMAYVKATTPVMNPDISNGLAYTHGKLISKYLDRTIRAVCKMFEATTEFHYVGMEMMTPKEEYKETTKGKSNGPRMYDLARSDVHMVKLKFQFRNIEFEKPILLPFVSEGGLMYIRGTRYLISPVMIDRVFSIVDQKIFVMLISVRFIIEKTIYTILENDIKLTYHVVKGKIHKVDKSSGIKRKFHTDTPLVFYLLCRYGMDGLFSKYLQCPVRYGTYGEIITEEEFPKDKYTIYRSTGIKPPKLNVVGTYTPNSMAFAVPNEYVDEKMRTVMAGLFFILDQFTEEFDNKYYNDTQIWKLSLGRVIFGNQTSFSRMLADIEDHLSSVEQYMDEIVRSNFKQMGMVVNDIYDLFFLVTANFEKWLRESIGKEANLYNKEITILRYLLSDLVHQMVLFCYAVKKKAKFGTLKENDIREALRQKVRPDAINSLNKGHGEISVLSYSGDNMVIGATKSLIPQEKTTKGKGNNKKKAETGSSDRSMLLDASCAEVTTHLTPTKADPTGNTVLSQFVQLDEHSCIVRNEELRERLDVAAEWIAKR